MPVKYVCVLQGSLENKEGSKLVLYVTAGGNAKRRTMEACTSVGSFEEDKLRGRRRHLHNACVAKTAEHPIQTFSSPVRGENLPPIQTSSHQHQVVTTLLKMAAKLKMGSAA